MKLFSPITGSVLLSCLLLAGCSGEPSESEMKVALERSLEGVNHMTSTVFGADTKIEIVAVQNLGCEKQERGHVCEIEVETKAPIVGIQREISRVRFVKGSEHWVVAD